VILAEDEAMPKTLMTERRRGRLARSEEYVEDTVKSFDGTPIVYSSTGKGSPPIICCNGLGVGSFFWNYFVRYFRPSYQVVTWDYRGHGASGLQDEVQNYTLDALVEDTKAVLDILKIEKAIFVGHSLGVQLILEFYHRYPDRVASLVPCFGTDGQPMNTFFNTRLSRYLFQVCYEVGQRFPTFSNMFSTFLLKNPLSFQMGGLLKIVHTGMADRKDMDSYIKHLLNVSPTFFMQLLKSMQEHSAQSILPDIKVPTLIIAAEDDQFTPLWISKKMHRLIPYSELFIVKKGTHAALVEQPELINLRIEKFLDAHLGGRAALRQTS
jgi:pimeloyl-ACP methyl ester carboxylesterase